MAKPKPDHREQVEVKLGQKERTLLDDFQMTQTFKAGGGIFSDLGQGIGSVLSAFTTGGDAGLLMALGAAYIVDERLDLKSDKDLQEWLNNYQLYSGPKYGIYPSVLPNRNGGYGGPVCFVDPADFTQDYYQYDAKNYGTMWGSGSAATNDAYSEIMAAYNNQMEHYRLHLETAEQQGAVNKPQPPAAPLPFDDKSWPWWIFVPALTYDDPCPQELGIYSHLRMKYNMDLVLGGEGKNNDIIFVWNNQMEYYGELWNQLSPDVKMAMYIQGGGTTRTEVDSLMQILGSLDNLIPGAGAIQEIVEGGAGLLQEVGETTLDLYKWGSKKLKRLGHYFANPTPTITTSQSSSPAEPVTTYYVPEAGYVEWPVWAMPPKNLYKFQTIHTTVEVIKVCIPWYLGTKFAISAAGAIIPG